MLNYNDRLNEVFERLDDNKQVEILREIESEAYGNGFHINCGSIFDPFRNEGNANEESCPSSNDNILEPIAEFIYQVGEFIINKIKSI